MPIASKSDFEIATLQNYLSRKSLLDCLNNVSPSLILIVFCYVKSIKNAQIGKAPNGLIIRGR